MGFMKLFRDGMSDEDERATAKSCTTCADLRKRIKSLESTVRELNGGKLPPSSDTTCTFHHVFCETKPQDRKVDPNLVGKWLVYVSAENVDATWNKISKLTIKGKLGISAKVSTAKNEHLYKQRVICVYTHPYSNFIDVMRVRKELRKLGFRDKLNYKTDTATILGKEEYLYTI